MQVKKYNYGFALLRIWMCFEVILVHFKDWGDLTFKDLNWFDRVLFQYERYAVPIFMILSFVLIDIERLANSNQKIRQRFYRLLEPHFFWAFIYYFTYRLLSIKNKGDVDYNIKDLLWQLVLGHSINQTEWFQIELIALTALFVVIFQKLKYKRAVKALYIMLFVALILEYSGINGSLFDRVVWKDGFRSDYLIYPVGRFVEMMPYAIVGVLVFYYQILDKIVGFRVKTILFSCIAICVLLNFKLFPNVGKSYNYAGLTPLVISCLTIFMFFCIPFEMFPDFVKNSIKFVSQYTMAIYYIHRMVGSIIYNTGIGTLVGMRNGSIHDCAIIFLVCFLVAWLISIIPNKIIKNAVL